MITPLCIEMLRRTKGHLTLTWRGMFVERVVHSVLEEE